MSWRFGAAIRFEGHVFQDYGDFRKVPQEVLDRLLHAIQTREVVLHGNYMFSQRTSVFDSQSSEEQRTASVREAVRILRNPTLSPREKAHDIMKLRGFGPSNATALVLYFHPAEHPICNKRSATAVHMLGLLPPFTDDMNAKDVDNFEMVARDINEALGAPDHLELDTYFDLVFWRSPTYGVEAYAPVPVDTIGDEEDEVAVPEGAAAYRIHVAHERNRALVTEAKRQFKLRHGHLFCEACHFDFGATYGVVGEDYIEAHHTIPVSTLQAGDTTWPSQLAMVCSNCHRMLHRRRPWLTVEELGLLLMATAVAAKP